MPACESVNERNTPTAYSGISALVLPPNAMIERAGRGREHEHAVREHEPVAAVGELSRQVAVGGDDRRQPREVGVRGVRREREDRRGRELQHHVQHGAAAEHRGAELRHHRRVLARVRPEVVGQDLHAHEQRAEDDAHPHERGGGVLRLRAPERRARRWRWPPPR